VTVLNLTVEVLSTGVRGLPAVRALEREYARITRYDGERVTVTVETPALPPLIAPARDLQPLLRGALRAADAAVSPWYRADPVGDPYEERVEAATRSFRDILAASAPRVARNRADYIRDHFDALNVKFGYTRGPVETAFRNLLLPQKQ
jgi:hypothetical protein